LQLMDSKHLCKNYTSLVLLIIFVFVILCLYIAKLQSN
jgi:hypothetical protein